MFCCLEPFLLIYLILLFLFIPRYSYTEVDKITIMLTPKPENYASGVYTVAGDGYYYFGGKLNGVEGVLKVNTVTGETEMLIADSEAEIDFHNRRKCISNDGTMQSYASINIIRNRDTGQRVVKALSHLIKLCGGKGELF